MANQSLPLFDVPPPPAAAANPPAFGLAIDTYELLLKVFKAVTDSSSPLKFTPCAHDGKTDAKFFCETCNVLVCKACADSVPKHGQLPCKCVPVDMALVTKKQEEMKLLIQAAEDDAKRMDQLISGLDKARAHAVKQLEERRAILQATLKRCEPPTAAVAAASSPRLKASLSNRSLAVSVVSYSLSSLGLHCARTIGGANSGRGVIKTPREIVFSRGKFYVADRNSHRVYVYAYDGTHERFIAPVAQPKPPQPHGVFVTDADDDSKALVYIADAANHCVHVLRLDDGSLVRKIGDPGGNGQLTDPVRVIVDKDHVYVADCNGHRIVVFSLDGRFVRAMGTGKQGKGNGEVYRPRGLCVVEQELFVADSGNNRVVVFGLDGAFKRSFKLKDASGGLLRDPRGVYFSCGLLYVAEHGFENGFGCLAVFRPDGSFVCEIGRGELKKPHSVVSVDGKLFVTDDGLELIAVLQ